MRHTSYLFVGLLLTAAVYFIYHQLQGVLTYGHFPLADGNQYVKLFDYFKNKGGEAEVKFPFSSRILVPWLAALLPGKQAVLNFKLINFLFALASVVALFMLWRKLKISVLLISVGFLWLVFHWTGMIRLNLFDPIAVDLPLYLFPTLLMLVVLQRKFWWLLLLGPVATLQKESFIPLLLILFIYSVAHNRFIKERVFPLRLIFAALVLSIFTQLIAAHYFPPIESGRNSVITVLFHAKEILLNPFKIIRWLAAFVVAFGLFPIMAARQWRQFKPSRHINLLGLFSLTGLAMSILGGDDYTRLIFLNFPFIMTLMMLFLRYTPKNQLLMGGLLSLPLLRFWEQIPDPAYELENWQSWYPEFAFWPLVLFYLLYAVSFVFLSRKFLKERNRGRLMTNF